jgi:signal transduction histidine kinase
MSIALAGVVVIQFYWIKNAITLKQEQFDRSVNTALIRVSADLENKYGVHLITEKLSQDSAVREAMLKQDPGFYKFMININDDGSRQEETDNYEAETVNIIGDETAPAGNATLRAVHRNQSVVTTVTVNGIKNQEVSVRRVMDANTQTQTVELPEPPAPPLPPQGPQNYQLNKIVQNCADEYALSQMKTDDIYAIIDSAKIRASIVREFQKAGLPENFEFATYSTQGDTLVINKASSANPILDYAYQSPLLATDFVEASSLLLVNFPLRFKYMFESIAGMLLLSLIFTLAIVSAFAYSLHLIFKQKKLSEITNDFINNMTHELKTPLATISLTADTLAMASVSNNTGMVSEYSGMIKTEVKKLSRHVDRILEAAINEQTENEPDRVIVSLNELVNEEVKIFEPQAGLRGGQINAVMPTEELKVVGNRDLLRGVICNLLDNALKYSGNAPEITIGLTRQNKTVQLFVYDQGIGISKSEQKMVFEKFYRAHTGNRHDVKGFGLGLSFAKDVVEHLGGKISVQSEPGKGSKFFVELPLI